MPNLGLVDDCMETKLVISDGVVMRCKLVDNSYVPMEMLDVVDVIKNIRAKLSGRVPLRRWASAPSSPLRPGSTNFALASPKGRLVVGGPRRNSFPTDVLKQQSLAQNRVRLSDAAKTNSVCLPMHSPKKSSSLSSVRGQLGARRQKQVCDVALDSLQAVLSEVPTLSSAPNTPTRTRNGVRLAKSDSEESSIFISTATVSGCKCVDDNYNDFESDVASDSDSDGVYDNDDEGDIEVAEDCAAGVLSSATATDKNFNDVMSFLASSEDYVHINRFSSFGQFRRFLEACSKSKRSVALDVLADVNCSVSVVFQFLDNFKQDFMMLNLNKEYMFFLRPF